MATANQGQTPGQIPAKAGNPALPAPGSQKLVESQEPLSTLDPNARVTSLAESQKPDGLDATTIAPYIGEAMAPATSPPAESQKPHGLAGATAIAPCVGEAMAPATSEAEFQKPDGPGATAMAPATSEAESQKPDGPGATAIAPHVGEAMAPATSEAESQKPDGPGATAIAPYVGEAMAPASPAESQKPDGLGATAIAPYVGEAMAVAMAESQKSICQDATMAPVESSKDPCNFIMIMIVVYYVVI